MTPREQCRAWLRGASSVTVLTGAGVSAESGIPTFRSSGSGALPAFWKKFRPEEVATPEAFRKNPEMVWRWYDWRRVVIAGAKPNPGHFALAKLELRCAKFALVTQNVDGLHHAAGSRGVAEIHGSIWTLRCMACGVEWVNREAPLALIPPKCACGGLARPGVVWFGEELPAAVWSAAAEAARSCEVLLIAGTSAVVYPAASLVPMARGAGARIIEVNLEATPASNLVDCALRGTAGEILPSLLDNP